MMKWRCGHRSQCNRNLIRMANFNPKKFGVLRYAPVTGNPHPNPHPGKTWGIRQLKGKKEEKAPSYGPTDGFSRVAKEVKCHFR